MSISTPKLTRTMDRLGYAESTIGTRYLRQAVEIAEGLTRVMVCKDIYPEVAKLNGVAPANVERAIRTATEKAMRSPFWEYNWRELGGWGHPTNAEVIARLARETVIED